jgi:hypothetical protein
VREGHFRLMVGQGLGDTASARLDKIGWSAQDTAMFFDDARLAGYAGGSRPGFTSS